jgi:hypothetical protein
MPPRKYLLAILAAAVASAAAPAGAVPTACFGAAARDESNPCVNPALQYSVRPTPADAPLQPSALCRPIKTKGQPQRICAFGAARASATATIALLGDSHAPAWRAAVAFAARGKSWRGLTVRRSGCPFNFAMREVGPGSGQACAAWVVAANQFLARHPEIATVFVVNSSHYRWVPRPGLDAYATAVEGYSATLRALPPSVRQVVVLRDNPQAAVATRACVAQAHTRRADAATTCALPRADALVPDPLFDAAAALGDARVRTIDLSQFFCDAALCYPVVGGALVFKDLTHITTTFSTSLGPYLLNAFDALGTWR